MSFHQNRSIFSNSSTGLHSVCNAVVLQLLNSNVCGHWNEQNAQNSIKTYETIQENPWGKSDSQVLLLRNIHGPALEERSGKDNLVITTEILIITQNESHWQEQHPYRETSQGRIPKFSSCEAGSRAGSRQERFCPLSLEQLFYFYILFLQPLTSSFLLSPCWPRVLFQQFPSLVN